MEKKEAMNFPGSFGEEATGEAVEGRGGGGGDVNTVLI